MTDPLAPQDDGNTALTPDEREGLRLSYITTRAELNEAEQANILNGSGWAFSRKRDVLDEGFLKKLHARMYGNVWNWAGQYRDSGKNIGIEAHKISAELRTLLQDVRYWIDHNTYPVDEIGARFHHRLTYIHCYANGNGRHARLATDLLLKSLGEAPFSWSHANLVGAGNTRERYIAALRAADGHNIAPLLAFVRA